MSMVNDGFGPNPNLPQQAPKKSNALKWVLGILAVLGVTGLLCCGGCLLMAKMGFDQVGKQIVAQVENDPVIVEHLGQNLTASMEIMATGELQQATGDSDAMSFAISGDKGSGQLTGTQVGPNQFGNFVLIKDGQSYPLGK
ncbi:Cytochrome oxidase complex assembly protein 1 [Roseimaritima multifibrata]|uniref:Cytochrome oxidase complex assembly protein 1 n=1 Tax=Roseimaritima multifibrata TaxID=1930274 RepID=A0A517M8Z7_9BACT|nr:cytochrome c oxidase assembly factor Coa1 family protein [Roseimaritima multifibrata]QDS91362.1 Cytochrome oxidase complex assembly protein 1 [Roseimaritima multifibrata]